MEIKISNSKIIEEVLLLTTYSSAKTAKDAESFDNQRATIHDSRLLQTLIRFASAELTSIMADILTEIQTTEELIKISLSPFLTIETSMADALYESFLRFYVEFVISRWFGIFQPDRFNGADSGSSGSEDRLRQLAQTLLSGKILPEPTLEKGKIARRRRWHPF